MDSSTVITGIRWILTAELLLGGQARLTDKMTPTVHKKAMSKADGYRRYLPFIPASNSTQHSQIIGGLMCIAGGVLCTATTRTFGASLSMSLSIAGWYSQARMCVPYLLPIINTVLAGLIITHHNQGALAI